MRADINGAAALVTMASAFDWVWNHKGLERFCIAAGWGRPDNPNAIPTNMNLPNRWATAWARLNPGYLDFWGGVGEDLLYVQVNITDLVDRDDPSVRPIVSRTFLELNDRLMAELGPPDGVHVDGEEWIGSYWHRSDVGIFLDWSSGDLSLRFENPRYTQLNEYVDSLDEDN